MALSQEMQEMVDVIKNHASKLMASGTCKHYYAPDIPDKVKNKLIKKFDSSVSVNGIIAFFDTTVTGNSAYGLLFTNDGFYHKFMMEKATYIRYVDVEYMRAEKDKLIVAYEQSDYEFSICEPGFDIDVLKEIIEELIRIDRIYGLSSNKSSGKIKKIELPPELESKCKKRIHTAAVACGGVGAAGAQIPGSDNAVIVPIQIALIIDLGAIFELDITESAAKSILASAAATVAGRTTSQFLVGWIPGIGNVINTATAAGVTEAIGWLTVTNFYNRWLEDRNKGKLEAKMEGYEEASGEYERKLRKQAEEFLNQKKDIEREHEEYEKLLDEYEKYIEELEAKCAAYDEIKRIRDEYKELKSLQSA